MKFPSRLGPSTFTSSPIVLAGAYPKTAILECHEDRVWWIRFRIKNITLDRDTWNDWSFNVRYLVRIHARMSVKYIYREYSAVQNSKRQHSSFSWQISRFIATLLIESHEAFASNLFVSIDFVKFYIRVWRTTRSRSIFSCPGDRLWNIVRHIT